MVDQGPEPTNWELMRRLDKVDQSIAKLGTDFVSAAVYAADKQGNDARHLRAETEIAELKTNSVDAEKQRRSTRLAISIGIASPILSGVIVLLVRVIP